MLDAPNDKKQKSKPKRMAAAPPLVEPSVRLPGGVNVDFNTPLRNTCPSTRALHIQQRCAAIAGKTFAQVRGQEFPNRAGDLVPYSRSQ